jgi:hypothetical protein
MKTKKGYSFFIIILLLMQSIFSLQAQTTSGTDFWLTFGRNIQSPYTSVDLQICIVGGNAPTEVTIAFTDPGIPSVSFLLSPQEVYIHNLTPTQKQAVYNTVQGKTNKSIHITTKFNHPVTAYALNQFEYSTDATNILPVTALGVDYYYISYLPSSLGRDTYAVVATEDNTQVWHNGGAPIETLNTGEVYYMVAAAGFTDMTGAHITANHPIALFAVNPAAAIPMGCMAVDNLFQQLAPIRTWGKIFFVPVSHLGKDIVRIVASEDQTTISQTGGVMLFPIGGQTGYTIDAGQFIELMVSLTNNGCSIQADKPIGVCTYLTGAAYNGLGTSDPAQAWLPAIEQKAPNALIAPFIPVGASALNQHRAIVITSTNTKTNTMVSIGGASATPLTGGNWMDNSIGMSFYNMPLTNPDASYYFTNNAGLIVMCYGVGPNESYYYLAGSSMHDLDAAFYANDVHYQDLKESPFCENEVEFLAEIEGELHADPGHLKWYIDGIEEISERDHLTWSKTFSTGEYEIRMWCRFDNNDTISKTGFLAIQNCNLTTAFYANNVHYENLPDTTFCAKDVYFRAEIEGALHEDTGSLKWYIDGIEYEPARDRLEWSKPFETGVYAIEMWVRFANDKTATILSTLKMDVFWVKIRNIKY